MTTPRNKIAIKSLNFPILLDKACIHIREDLSIFMPCIMLPYYFESNRPQIPSPQNPSGPFLPLDSIFPQLLPLGPSWVTPSDPLEWVSIGFQPNYCKFAMVVTVEGPPSEFARTEGHQVVYVCLGGHQENISNNISSSLRHCSFDYTPQLHHSMSQVVLDGLGWVALV